MTVAASPRPEVEALIPEARERARRRRRMYGAAAVSAAALAALAAIAGFTAFDGSGHAPSAYVHPTVSRTDGQPDTWLQYVARAQAICTAATKRFRAGQGAFEPGGTLRDDARVNEAAARLSERVLVKLRQLPLPRKWNRPRAMRAKWFALAEQQTAALHAVAAAAAAGDQQRWEKLSWKRVYLTHQKGDYLPSQCPLGLVRLGA